MFEKINNLLDVFLKNKNLKKNKKRDQVEFIWEKRIEKKIQKNTTILDFKEGVLLVKAKNPTWKMEISLMKETLKKKLINRTK
tara:strand:+ start:8847 stop:9095 length:249 start_codon:yes stop_codon:yes gene_type:complete